MLLNHSLTYKNDLHVISSYIYSIATLCAIAPLSFSIPAMVSFLLNLAWLFLNITIILSRASTEMSQITNLQATWTTIIARRLAEQEKWKVRYKFWTAYSVCFHKTAIACSAKWEISLYVCMLAVKGGVSKQLRVLTNTQVLLRKGRKRVLSICS